MKYLCVLAMNGNSTSAYVVQPLPWFPLFPDRYLGFRGGRVA